MSEALPRGLIVDYGGVMTVPEADVFAAFARAEGVPVERVRDIAEAAFDGRDPDGIVVRRERGDISVSEFERGLAAALSQGLGRTVDPAGLHGRLFAAERLEPGMVDAVDRLRAAGVRTAMLSNTWGDGIEQDALAHLFDAMVLSSRVGLRKPDPRIFRVAAHAIVLSPEDCLLVDDVAANTAAAATTGMRTILHEGADSTIEELERTFGIPLR